MGKSKRALLVGINDYPDNELAGCVNDVKAIKQVLVQKLGYRSEEINLLTDKKATRAGILDGLSWLEAGAGEGDTRLFYYSGHGGQVPDPKDDEADGWDETLVPRDTFATGEMLSDDTLRAEYAGMLKKKAHLVLVMDCCHSGTNNRGEENLGQLFRFIPPSDADKVKARAKRAAAKKKKERAVAEMILVHAEALAKKKLAPKALKTAILQLKEEAGAKYDRKREAKHKVTGNGVLIAGCQDSQLSEERQFGSKRHGALTYYLLQALKSGALPYGELVDKVTEELRNRMFEQEPRLECTKQIAGVKFLQAT